MNLSKLRVILTASVGGFNRSMRSAGSAMTRMAAKAGSLAKSIFSLRGIMSAFLAVLAVKKLFDMAKGIFDLGAAVAETQAKFETTFGAMTAQVTEFIETWAVMAGLTRQTAKDMVATTGSMLIGMGMTQDGAADLSQEILTLAGDFASFNNLKTEDTLRSITSALAGEREAMKRLGVVLLETEVQQRAMALSGVTNAKALDQSTRALATVELIAEKAGVQLGDLERTQNSAANRAKQLGAQWGNLRNTITTLLQPAFLGLMETFLNAELNFETMEDAIRENARVIVGWVAGSIEAFRIFSEALVGLVRQSVNLLGLLARAFANPGTAAINLLTVVANLWSQWDALGDIQGRVAGKFNDAMRLFDEAADGAGGSVRDFTYEVANAIDEVTALDDMLAGFATDFSERIATATQEGKEAFEGFFQSVIDGLVKLAAKMAIFKGLEFMFPDSDFVRAFGRSNNLISNAAGTVRVNSPAGPVGTPNPSTTGFSGPLPPIPIAAPTLPPLPDLGEAAVGRSGQRALLLPGRGGMGAGDAGGDTLPSRFVQNVNFNFSAIDAAGVAGMIEQQKGNIVAVVADAAQNSATLRRTLRG